MTAHATVLIEIDASEFFHSPSNLDGFTADWHYCNNYAPFQHNDACEFILHIGSDADEEDSLFQATLKGMKMSGCSQAFMDAYKWAKDMGAVRVLFYA